MKSVTAVISTLFRCGIIGGLYGALLGVIYVGLLGVSEALRTTDVTFLAVPLPGLMLFGAFIGFPAGFISGVLGGSLGGPIGYSIGGLIGTGAITLPFAIYPSI